MDESSQSRVDLSGIHPLKRLTLIVLWFMFGVSLTLWLALQFVWMDAMLSTPFADFGVGGTKEFSWLSITSATGLTMFDFQYGHYEDGISPHFEIEELDSLRSAQPESIVMNNPAPGLRLLRVQASPVMGDGCALMVHPIWLVSTCAALYVFALWRFRRTARLKRLSS